ncbi:MAG: hypothetical protein JWP01_923 [Myxococcales bacterium]|nr:hypothetical protein [Myxococcales bacterium]
MTTSRWLMITAALAAASLVGCAGSADGANDECNVSLLVTPSTPIAGPDSEVTVTASTQSAPGVLAFDWRVTYMSAPIPFDVSAPNESEITFTALEPGIYEVTLDIGSGSICPQQSIRVNVLPSGSTTLDVRLHVTPPITIDVPPIDRRIRVFGGTDYDLGPVVLDPGVRAIGNVRTAGNVGVPAYLAFVPDGMSEAVVESFSDAAGAYSTQLLNSDHEVLVIPASSLLAPRKLPWTTTQTTLMVDGGTLIAGLVRHGGVAIAGARVQLMIDGVPSTLGTTAGDGSFTVRGVPSSGAMVAVEVQPPVSTGLPRLEAFGTFDLGTSLAITYSSLLTTRNLAGTQVRRNGSIVPGAKVTVVGELGAIGTVVTGATSATASGVTRVTVTADAGGTLPSLIAPAAALSAVVTVDAASQDLAVAALDLTTGVPSTISAPSMTTKLTTVLGEAPLDGARLDLVPTGALALAGVPTRQLTGDGNGAVVISFPSGSKYDAYFSDPAGRSGQRVVLDLTSATVGTSYTLGAAVNVSGTLRVTGNPNRIRGASVQILCMTCSGLDRDRPLAEDASDEAGDFVLAVPDPGTM